MALTFMTRESGAVTEVVISGEWDLTGRKPARQAIDDLLARRPRSVVCDLSALEFADSTAVHCVCELNDRCGELGIDLVIIAAPGQVHRMFEVCGVTDSLPFAALALDERRHARFSTGEPALRRVRRPSPSMP